MLRRTSWLVFSIVPAVAALAGSAPAEPGPRRAAAASARDAAHDARERLRDARQDLRDARSAARDGGPGAPSSAASARVDAAQAAREWREKRVQRRQAHREILRKKYGPKLDRPEVRAELTLHARRIARLDRAERLATDAGRDAVVTRAQKLRDKENARHDRRMAALTADGGTP